MSVSKAATAAAAFGLRRVVGKSWCGKPACCPRPGRAPRSVRPLSSPRPRNVGRRPPCVNRQCSEVDLALTSPLCQSQRPTEQEGERRGGRGGCRRRSRVVRLRKFLLLWRKTHGTGSLDICGVGGRSEGRAIKCNNQACLQKKLIIRQLITYLPVIQGHREKVYLASAAAAQIGLELSKSRQAAQLFEFRQRPRPDWTERGRPPIPEVQNRSGVDKTWTPSSNS